ncbi:hypothetical protein CROQUDRAFT_305777 [Cronartium quercuum f. sp. fusiforme G11]|uniref:Uncharacterized protein n=1 Tax=Cronartium quercuum f. sp. fusiforme G11 TaxID=708437 RepID=A0A9P6NBV1_9BASI|nr:hypothetical protein CROQUDRAFT_305777 [Cronartium quercuum f. sp. fusiforme G11]
MVRAIWREEKSCGKTVLVLLIELPTTMPVVWPSQCSLVCPPPSSSSIQVDRSHISRTIEFSIYSSVCSLTTIMCQISMKSCHTLMRNQCTKPNIAVYYSCLLRYQASSSPCP